MPTAPDHLSVPGSSLYMMKYVVGATTQNFGGNGNAIAFARNGRDGARAPLDEGRGFAVFWFNPFPAPRTHARHPSQYPSRSDQRRPHRPRQDRAAGGDPGVRVDLG